MAGGPWVRQRPRDEEAKRLFAHMRDVTEHPELNPDLRVIDDEEYMGRQSHKALERLKHIASMGESEAKQYLRNEKGGKPEEDSAGSLERVVLRQRRCQWLTELKGWKDCGEVATHVRVDCGLCYCRLHASTLMPFVPLEPLPQND